MSQDKIYSIIENLDPEVMKEDLTDALMKIAPTMEETEAVQEFTDLAC